MHRARFCVLTLAVAASLLLGAGIAVTQAMAATLTFNFTGDVTKVHEGLSPPFAVNSSPTAMTGSLTLDTFDHNTAGKFQITSFNMNIEGKKFSQGSPSSLEVETKHGAMVSADVRVHTPIGPADPRELFIKLHEPGALARPAMDKVLWYISLLLTALWLAIAVTGCATSGELLAFKKQVRQSLVEQTESLESHKMQTSLQFDALKSDLRKAFQNLKADYTRKVDGMRSEIENLSNEL